MLYQSNYECRDPLIIEDLGPLSTRLISSPRRIIAEGAKNKHFTRSQVVSLGFYSSQIACGLLQA